MLTKILFTALLALGVLVAWRAKNAIKMKPEARVARESAAPRLVAVGVIALLVLASIVFYALSR